MVLHKVATDSRQALRDPVLAKLSSLASLSEHEIGLIGGVWDHVRQHRAGAELDLERDVIGRPRAILTGWACRARLFEDGRRQIFGVLVPGDAIGLCSRPSPRAMSATIALTPVKIGDARVLAEALNDEDDHATSGLRAALLISAGIEEAGMLDQVARLGRQTAYERTVHLILELHWRLGLAGLASGNRFPLPMTQEMLADTLGLSIVHVNRTLQQLRRDEMLELASGYCELLKPDLLAGISGFDAPSPSHSAHFGG